MPRSGYQKRVASLNPTYWLRFDENGTPSDYGSSSLQVSVTGTPSYNQASFGTQTDKSVILNGTNGFSSTANTSIFNDKVFTIECWFKISNADVLSSNYHTFFIASGSAGQVLGFRMKGAAESSVKGTLQMYYLAGSGFTDKFLTTTTNYADGNWHHTALTFSSTTAIMYVDGAQITSVAINTSFPSTLSLDGTGNKVIGYAANEGLRGSFNEFAIYDSTLTVTQLSDNYAARNWGNYDAEVGEVSTSTFVMPTITIVNAVNATYAASPMLADTAVFVHPTIEAIRNINYSADPSTASATSPNATVAAEKYADYSASPATASALLSSNFYGGNTEQDSTYNLTLRELQSDTGGNITANGGFSIGRYKTGSTITFNQKFLLLIPTSGIPDRNKLVKVKFNSAHLGITTTNDIAPDNRFNIYKVTSAISSPTTVSLSQVSKTLLYTTRLLDDSTTGNSNFYLDLTPAFADETAYTNGIVIESANEGTSYTGWDETIFTGSNLQNNLLYILSADVANKTINADIMTASALATDATIAVQVYLSVSADPSTANADIVTPTAGLSTAFNAAPATASGEAIQPTFNRTVEYPHTFAEAFATTVTPTLFIEGYNNYNAAPATAEALFHDPQTQIGDEHSAASMDGSALFVDPLVIINRSVDAMTTIASALFVNPTTNLQLLAAVTASPMTANAMSPNPPAYTNLLGDDWYAALYAQHSIKAVGFPTSYSSAFLKLYEDQNTDITQFTPATATSGGRRTLRQLFNNLTQTITTNGAVENDTPDVQVNVVTDYSTPENESRLSVGYFDPYGRKAVRLQNIGIRMAQPLYHARADFSLEFSIKTTKADQILSYAEWSSPNGPGRIRGLYNLVDGKVNVFTYGDDYRLIHPKQRYGNTVVSGTSLHGITGYQQINDDQWHHVVIQYTQGTTDLGTEQGRYQVWIDGELDIQRFGANLYEPDFFGANIENATYAPDFYTSATSLDAPAFIAERDIDLHYFDYIKYEPIFAEPMTASLTMTQDNKGAGNRKRALMLYWWPSNTGQNKNFIYRQFDTFKDNSSFPDYPMFEPELDTIDYVKQAPQQYYGWDVFPVDINGYYVSDLVKEQAYGGPENIILNDVGGSVGPFDGPRPQFKVNRAGFFKQIKDDTRRYIDLVNDIDLSQFDAIFFKNYPDQSGEQESFAKNEIVDTYFNIRETVIFENFIKSLRAAVDTGISLMVNNPQLALDLKIVDRIELVPDLNDISGYESDPYSPTIVPDEAKGLPINTGNSANLWHDAYRNNRFRVLNTIPGLTDWRSVIRSKMAHWSNDDSIDFGGADRSFYDYELKPNGLSVGDEFFHSVTSYKPSIYSSVVAATPINNVLCGTPITAFANQYRNGLNLVDNPYKNHVTSIAIRPGDVLNGKQVGGKIFVNFTETMASAFEEASIDAIHTDWIEAAYFDGTITLAERNDLISSINNLETRLNQGTITQAEYNDLSAWASNGMYLLAQSREIEAGDPGRSDFGGTQARKGTVRKTSRSGITSSSPVSFNQQWFLFTYSKQFRQLFFDVISMTTRGFRWISDRVEAVGQTQTHTAMPASATIVQPIVVANRENNITVQPMLANAIKVAAVGFAGTDRNIISLPLEASATIVQPIKKVSAEPMTASAEIREQVVIRTTAQDQVVVYVLHEDPILYLREDIIK